jgi:hypothetical protein
LHEACGRLGSAAKSLLTRAQSTGRVRPDLETHELLATANAAAWLGQPPVGLSPRRFLALFAEGWHPEGAHTVSSPTAPRDPPARRRR